MIVFAAIVPHPPLSIPGVGALEDKRKMRQTLKAFDELRSGLEKARPDTLVIISPHAQMEKYAFVVNSAASLRGSFAKFGLDLVLEYENDVELSDTIDFAGLAREIPMHLHPYFLDHGALVPLFHLTGNVEPLVVHLAFSMFDFPRHYAYGELVGHICEQSGKRIAIIASGDLSHRITPDAPAGYSPSAALFDCRLVGILRRQDFPAILALQEDIIKEAAECGLRSFVILLGAIAHRKKEFQLLSYEYPFGIGYLVARLL